MWISFFKREKIQDHDLTAHSEKPIYRPIKKKDFTILKLVEPKRSRKEISAKKAAESLPEETLIKKKSLRVTTASTKFVAEPIIGCIFKQCMI